MATGKARSSRQQQARLVAELRTQGRTWAEVADMLRARCGVNMRTALRLAHGWTQAQAADEWNRRWPAEPKTFKNFSYWEQWPATTGYAPSLDVLAKLAELYACRISDLLTDCADFRHTDAAHQAQTNWAELTAGQGIPTLGDIPALADRMEAISVDELARAAAAWAAQAEVATNRRSLILKLSAALSLAAAEPAIPEQQPASVSAASPARGLAGVWHSRYAYYSDSRDQHLDSEHYIVFHQRADQLVGQSLPHTTGSRLELHLSVDNAIATGTWVEYTSPDGHYQGAVYHGTLQLVVNPMGRAMNGKWLGFGKDFTVNSGGWELSFVDNATSPQSLRTYRLKA